MPDKEEEERKQASPQSYYSCSRIKSRATKIMEKALQVKFSFGLLRRKLRHQYPPETANNFLFMDTLCVFSSLCLVKLHNSCSDFVQQEHGRLTRTRKTCRITSEHFPLLSLIYTQKSCQTKATTCIACALRMAREEPS